jgi:hypothetical protein
MGKTDQSVTTRTTLTYERDHADFGANQPLVEIYPRETVRRRAVGWCGISMELIQPTTHDRIECRFNGPERTGSDHTSEREMDCLSIDRSLRWNEPPRYIIRDTSRSHTRSAKVSLS